MLVEKYFVSPMKAKGSVAESILENGERIKLNGYTYVEISRKPKGKSILRKLKSMSSDTRFIIYK